MATMTGSTPLDDPRAIWRPSTAGYAGRAAAFIVLAIIALGLPLWLESQDIPEFINVVSRMYTYGVIALSMNILIGYAGQVSLGHQAFVGVGAFVSAFLLTKQNFPWLIAAVGAIVIGALTSLLLGAIALRVRGLFFALVTVAYGLFAESSVFQITALTGGGGGQKAPRPLFAAGDTQYAYLCLAGLLLAWVVDWRVTSSRAGRAIQALRDDERVAASWGIDVTRHKLLAFGLSGAVAGLAGAQFASIETVVSNVSFDFTLALTIVLMTVVGGVGSRPGVVIGGFVFATLATLLEEAHKAWGEGSEVLPTLPPRILQFVLGAAILAPVTERFVHWLRGDRKTGKQVFGWVVGMLIALGTGGALIVASIFKGYNIWATIDSSFVGLFGAVLLLATLIQFPGGIAEQFGPVLNWLSFKPFGAADKAGGGGAAGASMGDRP